MKNKWLAWGFVAAVAGAATAGTAACSGDDTSTPQDAGSDMNVIDDGVPDTGTDTGSDAADAGPARAKILVVHASPDVPPVRICFAVGTKSDGSDAVIAPFPPLPDKTEGSLPFPGLFPGTGGPLPDLGADLSQKVIVPYVIIASKVASDVAPADGGVAPVACDTLLQGDGGLTANVDYMKLPPIPSGTFMPGKTLLLAATGCLPTSADPNANVIACGADYDSTLGNVAIKIFDLDRIIADTQKSGAQVAHLSPKLFTGLLAGVTEIDAGSDAGVVYEPITPNNAPVNYAQLKPAPAASLSLPPASNAALVLSAVNPDGGAPIATFPVPFTFIYASTTGQLVGADQYFTANSNYTFVVVGDPQKAFLSDAGVDGYGLHVLAFPNDPPIPSYP